MKCLGGQYNVVMGKYDVLDDLEELVPTMLADTARTIGLTAATSAGVGAITTLFGGDAKLTMMMSAVSAIIPSLASSVMSALDISEANTSIGNKLCSLYTAASLLATITAFPVMGAKVGAGTHKLTTLAINKFKPEHQIERPAEVEPMPVIDEIQDATII